MNNVCLNDRPSCDGNFGRIVKIVFLIVVILEALVVAYSTGFDATDDHRFLASLAVGKPLVGTDIDLTHRRFVPVTGLAYNALLLVMPRVTSSALHAWNAIEFLFFAALLLKLLCIEVPRTVALLGAAVFLLQPSFVTAINRLLVPERIACLAIVIMLLCYRHADNRWCWITCILAANVTIYSKEPLAGAILIFAFCQIYMRRFRNNPRVADDTRSLDFLLAASAITFFLIYTVLTIHAHGTSYATARRFLPFAANASQNVRGYSLFSDPLLMMIALPLSFSRAWESFRKPSMYRGATDAALFAGVAYALAIFGLNLSYTSYYLLPAACFVWLGLWRFGAELLERPRFLPWFVSGVTLMFVLTLPTQLAGRFVIPAILMTISTAMMFCTSDLQSRIGSYVLCTALLAFGLNSFWGSVDAALLLKAGPRAYNAIIDDLAGQLRSKSLGRTNIFITGMTAGSGIEAFTSLDANLRFRGFSSANYDLVSFTPLDGVFQRDPNSAFAVFRDQNPRSPQKGDLILTPPGFPSPNASTTLATVELPATTNLGLDHVIQYLKRRYLKHDMPAPQPSRFSLCIDIQ